MTLRVVMKIIPARNKDAHPGVSCGLSGRDWPVILQAMTIRPSMYKLFSGSLQREDTPAGLLVAKSNRRASHLYEKTGFRKIGERLFASEIMDYLIYLA